MGMVNIFMIEMSTKTKFEYKNGNRQIEWRYKSKEKDSTAQWPKS